MAVLVDLYAMEPIWTTWKTEAREAGGKPTKVPYSIDGRRAKSNDPSTWMTFFEAEKAKKDFGHDGINIMLAPIGDQHLGGIDLDACIGPEGDVAPWAADIVVKVNSYTEVSPSGTGLRIFFLHDPALTGDAKHRWRKHVQKPNPAGGKDMGIELYLARHPLSVTDDVHLNYGGALRTIDVDTLYAIQLAMARFKEGDKPILMSDEDRLYSAIDSMENNGLAWEEWNTRGMGIHNVTKGSQRGYQSFLRWSQKSSKFTHERDCRERWENWQRSPADQVGEGTIFHHAYDAGWKDPNAGQRREHPKANGHDPHHHLDEQPDDDTPAKVPSKAKSFLHFPSPVVLTNEELDEDALPARQWLKGRSLLRGELTGIVGDSGIGKSSLELMTALAVVTGRTELVNEIIYDTGPAWVHNCEDSREEMIRRLLAIMKEFNIPNDEVFGKLFLTSGLDNEFIVINRDRTGSIGPTIHVDDCIAHIKDLNIIYANFDPFGAMVDDINENANFEVRKGLVQFKKIAFKTNASVAIDHHTGKPPRGVQNDPTDPNVARGAKAFVDTCRIVQQLTNITQEDADRFDVKPDDRHLFLRRDNGKTNMALKDGVALGWYQRKTIRLRNTDEVGVVIPHKFGKGEVIENIEQDRDRTRMIALVERRFTEGHPLSAAPQTKKRGRYLPTVTDSLPDSERIYYRRAELLMQDMLTSRALYEVSVNSRNKTTGLCSAAQWHNLHGKKEGPVVQP